LPSVFKAVDLGLKQVVFQVLFNKDLFLFLLSYIQTGLYLLDSFHNFYLGVPAEALYVFRVVHDRNVNCSFIFLLCILGYFGLYFLFGGPDSVKSVAVDVAVVILMGFLALKVLRIVQLTHITLLIFIFDNLVQITFKSEQLESTAPFAPSPLGSAPGRSTASLQLAQILFFKHEIIQNILDLLSDEPLCDWCEGDL